MLLVSCDEGLWRRWTEYVTSAILDGLRTRISSFDDLGLEASSSKKVVMVQRRMLSTERFYLLLQTS